MKKIILFLILAIAVTFTATAQQSKTESQIKVEVSETVELMSILARTAGYEEFSNDLVDTLRYYAVHRDKYPTLADFYPDIARCLEKYIENENGRK